MRATSWNPKSAKYVFLRFHEVALAYATTQHFVLIFETRSARARSHNLRATSWKRFYHTLTRVRAMHTTVNRGSGATSWKQKMPRLCQNWKH